MSSANDDNDRRNIDAAIASFLTSTGSEKDVKDGLGFLRTRILLALVRQYWVVRATEDPDFEDTRSGNDLAPDYSYETADDIYWSIRYISDRLWCAYRLAWLIGALDESQRDGVRPVKEVAK